MGIKIKMNFDGNPFVAAIKLTDNGSTAPLREMLVAQSRLLSITAKQAKIHDRAHSLKMKHDGGSRTVMIYPGTSLLITGLAWGTSLLIFVDSHGGLSTDLLEGPAATPAA